MAGPQAGADALRDFQKLWRFSDFERAVARKIAVDDVDDPARPRRHDYNLAGEKYRFRNRMGDEDNRLLGLVPKPQKLFVEMVTHDFVERAEWFVHQQERRFERQSARDRSALLHTTG